MPTGALPAQDLRFFPARVRPGCALAPAQLEAFNRDGYLLGLPVADAEEVARTRAAFDRLLRESAALGMDPYALANYERECAFLYDLVTHPRILAYVEAILGDAILCWGTHCFTKLPGDPKQVTWHQDATYWTLTPSKTVTAWLAIDDVDAGNGAMRVIPGSHHAGPLPLRLSTPDEQNALWLTIDGGTAGMPAPVTMQQRAGAMSLHTDLLIHDSPPNPSDRRRCGLAIRYCTPDVRLIGGAGRSAVICRGSDPSGYWQPVPRPTGDALTRTEIPVGRKVARPLSDFAPA